MSLRLPLRRRSLSNAQGEMIVLRGLPATATLKEVQDCLGSIRPISIDFHQDESGKFKGTVFVKLTHSDEAAHLIEQGCSLNGKKIKVEPMHHSLSAYSSLHSQSDVDIAKIESLITTFIASKDEETDLTNLSADERKIAHAFAERHCLNHSTKSPQGDFHSSTARVVHLDKHRNGSSSLTKSGSGTYFIPPRRLSVDAPVFIPNSDVILQADTPAFLPLWLKEKPARDLTRTSFVISSNIRQV
jgi:hypothetical protein